MDYRVGSTLQPVFENTEAGIASWLCVSYVWRNATEKAAPQIYHGLIACRGRRNLGGPPCHPRGCEQPMIGASGTIIAPISAPHPTPVGRAAHLDKLPEWRARVLDNREGCIY